MTGAETGGAYSLLEYHAPAGFPGPVPHLHREMDEEFYILDGIVTFTMDGRTIDAPAGTSVFVPRSVLHGFAIPQSAPARFLTLISPSGMEHYFVALAALFREAPGQSDPAALAALFARYDIVDSAAH